MSRSSRALWTAKILSGQRSQPQEDDATLSRRLSPQFQKTFHGVVLGIDPSLRGTGLALVDFTPEGARLLHSQTVKVKPGVSFAACLGEIFLATQKMVNLAPVKHTAIEQTIFVQSRKTVHILGSARGAAIAAVALTGSDVFEYAPLRIKQAVVGQGNASKEQVARMVAQHLQLTQPLSADESDAAATALCHAFTWRGN